MCSAPSSGLTSEDVTEVAIPASALTTTVRVAVLGYVAAPGEPSTILADTPSFAYYDAAVRHIHPRGGPQTGGTTITVSGRALRSGFVGATFGGAGGHPALSDQKICLFLASPPPRYSSTDPPAVIEASAPASALSGDRLVCQSPAAPASVQSAPGGKAILYVEAALNGYRTEHTTSTVTAPPTFTFYTAAVSRVHPLGGPTQGGTLLTLHGTNLDDYGGSLCRFTYLQPPAPPPPAIPQGTADTLATNTIDVYTPASVGSGEGGGSAMTCQAPAVDSTRLAHIGGTSMLYLRSDRPPL